MFIKRNAVSIAIRAGIEWNSAFNMLIKKKNEPKTKTKRNYYYYHKFIGQSH